MDELLQRIASDPKKIDSLLGDLDRIARDESPHEYGLPLYSCPDSLRLAVIKWSALF